MAQVYPSHTPGSEEGHSFPSGHPKARSPRKIGGGRELAAGGGGDSAQRRAQLSRRGPESSCRRCEKRRKEGSRRKRRHRSWLFSSLLSGSSRHGSSRDGSSGTLGTKGKKQSDRSVPVLPGSIDRQGPFPRLLPGGYGSGLLSRRDRESSCRRYGGMRPRESSRWKERRRSWLNPPSEKCAAPALRVLPQGHIYRTSMVAR